MLPRWGPLEAELKELYTIYCSRGARYGVHKSPMFSFMDTQMWSVLYPWMTMMMYKPCTPTLLALL
jgi:hypothetical protein